jgi:hypothetical protein
MTSAWRALVFVLLLVFVAIGPASTQQDKPALPPAKAI